MKKYIFITGGVVSSLGKGVASASIGNLLESAGLKINFLKLDPYLNIDPGTMNPFEHGEVFVTNDGAETDLDLGHYERFTHIKMSRKNNLTSGLMYNEVTKKERAGQYLGQTVQVIPHLTNHIQDRIFDVPGDFIICEIGGTVGDIESLPFLEAIRQVRLKLGDSNTMYIHMTSVPIISSNQEVKTKPTQHSVKELLSIGIQPDMLMCRCETPLSLEHRQKISLFTNVALDQVISVPDVDFIYKVPQVLFDQKIHERISHQLDLKPIKVDLKDWSQLIKKYDQASKEIRIGIIGKYTSYHDAYKSLHEALAHAAISHDCRLKLYSYDSESLTQDQLKSLSSLHGMVIPGGFGTRGIKGKLAAIQFAREQGIPTIGICLGMQLIVIEYFRNVLGYKHATSTEFDNDTDTPIFSLLEEWQDKSGQKKVTDDLGGTMRLGASTIKVKSDTLTFKIYQDASFEERHRHRYEFNFNYADRLEDQHLKIVGVSATESDLVEIVELDNHPWFIGCQFHPELSSTLRAPHPLFLSFMQKGLSLGGK
ncbi:MAG: CTP synthetase [Legionellales bacterium]|nr:CTP synthetase [Legionellales bacterium]OUX67500.1 MAG: CTP synthetase [bacterium TMED178]|tara:strand:- start:703 stop:2316 length:1614 start_codon:yes stop_codon:yes gene_type:complete